MVRTAAIIDRFISKDKSEKIPPLPENPTNDAPKRIYLNCPFAEKDECKSLGGKWDNDQRKWYISENINKEKFQKWLT